MAEEKFEQRTMTIPIVVKDVKALRDLAAVSARFANEQITKCYLEGKIGWDENQKIVALKEGKGKERRVVDIIKLRPYTDYNKELSGNARDAVNAEGYRASFVGDGSEG